MVHHSLWSGEDKGILLARFGTRALSFNFTKWFVCGNLGWQCQGKELFVPIKTKRKQLSKERLDLATTEVLTLVREAVQNDPTKELISFMKEEMEKSREHELRLFQLLLSHRPNTSLNSTPYSGNEHNPYSGNLGYYPSLHNATQGPLSHPGLRMSE